MNERIRELAEQAGAVFEQTNGLNDCSQDSLVGDEIEKFAELIVRECARIARATPCPYEEDEVRQRLGHTWDMASLEAGREIVKHFGVGK
jgi:hypothetical protein